MDFSHGFAHALVCKEFLEKNRQDIIQSSFIYFFFKEL